MIELDFGARRGDFALEAVARIDARVTGVLGRSGAGKSTLLAVVAGLLRPVRGSVRIGDDTLCDVERGIHVPPHRRRVGMVFQEARLLPHYRVRGNLRYGRPRDADERRFDEVVALLELGPLLDRRPGSLSGGERRRVAIGRALLAEPRLLLLDEPLASLDAVHRAQILPYLQRVCARSATPILYVSHRLEEVLYLTDRLVLLEHGRVVARGSYRDLAQVPSSLARLLPHGLRNVLRGTVARRDGDEGCLHVSLGDGGPVLRAGLAPVEAGARVVLSIGAEEVALAPEPVAAISIQNQLPGTVRRIAAHEGRIVVEVDVDGTPLIAEVTHGARRDLGLQPGGRVICLVKAHAIRVFPGAGR